MIDQLINFYEQIKKTVTIFKEKFMSFLETDKDYRKKIRGKKLRKQLKDKIFRENKAKINRDIKKVTESMNIITMKVLVINTKNLFQSKNT